MGQFLGWIVCTLHSLDAAFTQKAGNDARERLAQQITRTGAGRTPGNQAWTGPVLASRVDRHRVDLSCAFSRITVHVDLAASPGALCAEISQYQIANRGLYLATDIPRKMFCFCLRPVAAAPYGILAVTKDDRAAKPMGIQ